MNKQQVKKIVTWSTLFLIVPILGQLFVDGWNWGPGDFLFAWVFFNLLGFSCTFVMNKISHKQGKTVAGVLVFMIFACIWIMLATG